MAGEGQRFKDAGYTMPKPLIDVDGLPMVIRAAKKFTNSRSVDFYMQNRTY